MTGPEVSGAQMGEALSYLLHFPKVTITDDLMNVKAGPRLLKIDSNA
jgi:hypothetical protein